MHGGWGAHSLAVITGGVDGRQSVGAGRMHNARGRARAHNAGRYMHKSEIPDLAGILQ